LQELFKEQNDAGSGTKSYCLKNNGNFHGKIFPLLPLLPFMIFRNKNKKKEEKKIFFFEIKKEEGVGGEGGERGNTHKKEPLTIMKIPWKILPLLLPSFSPFMIFRNKNNKKEERKKILKSKIKRKGWRGWRGGGKKKNTHAHTHSIENHENSMENSPPSSPFSPS
jgi:hypothetical protein